MLCFRSLFLSSFGHSIACPWSVVLSGYSGFLHHLNWSSWYSWNIVESGVKTPKINQSIFRFTAYGYPIDIFKLFSNLFSMFIKICLWHVTFPITCSYHELFFFHDCCLFIDIYRWLCIPGCWRYIAIVIADCPFQVVFRNMVIPLKQKKQPVLGITNFFFRSRTQVKALMLHNFLFFQ